MTNKKLISKELINLVESELENAEFVKLKLVRFFSIRIGNIIIQKPEDGAPYMIVPEGLGKEYMSLWKNDVGQVVFRELKKDDPALYELKDVKFVALLKKVSHDEEKSFEEKELLHIKIGDSFYTIIKVISSGSNYHNKTNDFEYDLYAKEDDSIIIKDEPDDSMDNESTEKSYRLF